MNKLNNHRLANTLALHYFPKDEVDDEGWFDFAEQWFLKHGLEPNKMSGKGDKNISFKRGKLALLRENFKHLKSNSLWIAALLPEDQVEMEAFDFILAASLIKSAHPIKDSICKFSWDDAVIGWDNGYIQSLAKDLCSFLKPQYGYVFQREFAHGPGLYPSGIEGPGDVSDEEGYEIMKWGIVGLSDHPSYKPYMIRDVYPINFLSSQHLDAEVEGETLKQWIQEDPSRGNLTELLPQFWSWTLDKSSIDPVRNVLKSHDILIAFLDI